MKRLDELETPEGPVRATANWTDGLVMLCSKCSGQQHGQPPPEDMPSWDTWQLRCWLKDRLTAEGLWPRVRVVTTSCLGICAAGKITVALGADGAGGSAACLVLDPAQDAEALLETIRRAVAAQG